MKKKKSIKKNSCAERRNEVKKLCKITSNYLRDYNPGVQLEVGNKSNNGFTPSTIEIVDPDTLIAKFNYLRRRINDDSSAYSDFSLFSGILSALLSKEEDHHHDIVYADISGINDLLVLKAGLKIQCDNIEEGLEKSTQIFNEIMDRLDNALKRIKNIINEEFNWD